MELLDLGFQVADTTFGRGQCIVGPRCVLNNPSNLCGLAAMVSRLGMRPLVAHGGHNIGDEC